ncbi:hypothetical protein APC22_19750 [Acinetobacter pittii]|uniref:hypothetical protein n=1 Tax=Acinetobacter pittii TaxID=48296 RepID=UPI0007078882|nr:hypothetical protein [Acinetobacter pittii]KQF82644.1 hypothetical protein APC22_19750 [Acinetobacter pittii]
MIESMTPNMHIKQDFSAEIAAWVEQGNQITVLGRGESTHNKAFNNATKKTAQDVMRRMMEKFMTFGELNTVIRLR